MITIKSRREFAKMQKAGATVAAIHEAVREAAVPGVSLLALEEISARIIEERGLHLFFPRLSRHLPGHSVPVAQ